MSTEPNCFYNLKENRKKYIRTGRARHVASDAPCGCKITLKCENVCFAKFYFVLEKIKFNFETRQYEGKN